MKSALIVEDDVVVLDFVVKALKTVGLDVVAANCASDALEYLGERNFDVIITDIVMPGMDGIEFIERVRLTDRTTPIVAISGGGRMGGKELDRAAKDSGANQFLRKPFTLDELIEVLDRH